MPTDFAGGVAYHWFSLGSSFTARSDVVGRCLIRRHPARPVRSDQHDARLRAAPQETVSARAAGRAAPPGVVAHQRVARDRAQAREHRRHVGREVAAGLAVARVSRAARAAAGFDLVAAVAHEALAAGRPFARVRDERNLDGDGLRGRRRGRFSGHQSR